MVKLKKQIAIILILSFSLSLIPNFLYNEERKAWANDGGPCEGVTCPDLDCEKAPHEETNTCSCINCPIECELNGATFTNKSCLPLSGDLEEWACGREIPIGEVMERSSFLASKMMAEFGGMIQASQEMVAATELILNGNPETGLPPLSGANCEDMCATRCHKFFTISSWDLVDGPAVECAAGPQPPGDIEANKDCQDDASQCESCTECRTNGTCCWTTEPFAPNPEFPENTITCKYCPQAGSCQTDCDLYYRCGSNRGLPGCCGQYFSPVITGYADIEVAQEDLRNDIDEKYFDEGELKDLPDKFKFKRSYILEQLNFSRCELAQCWIPAEDYPAVLTGEKVGKHLFTCKTVSDMGLFEDDQLLCLVVQIMDEWEEIQKIWESPKHWWDWPVTIFKIAVKIVSMAWRTVWTFIKEWFDIGKEEGCYPTNYYCCQF